MLLGSRDTFAKTLQTGFFPVSCNFEKSHIRSAPGIPGSMYEISQYFDESPANIPLLLLVSTICAFKMNGRINKMDEFIICFIVFEFGAKVMNTGHTPLCVFVNLL